MPSVNYYPVLGLDYSSFMDNPAPTLPTFVGKTPVLLMHQYGVGFPYAQAGLYNETGDPDNSLLYSVMDNHKVIAGNTGPYEYVLQYWNNTDPAMPDHYLHWSQDDSYLDVDREDAGILPGVTKITDSSGYNWTYIDTTPANNGDTRTVLEGVRNTFTATVNSYEENHYATLTRANVYNGIGCYKPFVFNFDYPDAVVSSRPISNSINDCGSRGCRFWALI